MNSAFARIRTRLIQPLVRTRHTPEYIARSVMFGLMVALTPTVGVRLTLDFIVRLRLVRDRHRQKLRQRRGERRHQEG